MQETANAKLLCSFWCQSMAKSSVDNNWDFRIELEKLYGQSLAGHFWHGLIREDGIKLVGIVLKQF